MGSFMSGNVPFKLPPISVKLIIVVLFVVLVLVGAFTSIFIVDETEQSVITTLGKFNRVVAAGLHFKLPFGIEQNNNVPTNIAQNMVFGSRGQSVAGNNDARRTIPEEAIMLTGDLNIIEMQWIIQYNIYDPLQWLFKVDNRIQTIRDISQSVINELVGDRTIFSILGPARTEIENLAVTKMNVLFEKYELGVKMNQVELQSIVPPQGKVSDSFADIDRARQDMNKLINEGKQRYNSEIPKARGEAQQLIQQAQGYATERVNKAEGDVARFLSVLSQYRSDPANTRIRLYNEMMEDIFGRSTAENKPTLIDKNLDNTVPLLNLPARKGVTQ